MDPDKDIVACPHCGAKNRLGPHANGGFPVCGKCRNPLPWIVAATDATFRAEVGAPLVLVDFWASWCAPCKIVSPILEQISREQAGRLKIVKVDVDKNPGVAGEFLVQSVPTLVLFKNGQVVDTLVGAMPKSELLRRISPHL